VHLTEFLQLAPLGSPLRQFRVDQENRPLVEFKGKGYALRFYVEEHEDTDEFVDRLRHLFRTHGWEC
jgi:hypothetical protein